MTQIVYCSWAIYKQLTYFLLTTDPLQLSETLRRDSKDHHWWSTTEEFLSSFILVRSLVSSEPQLSLGTGTRVADCHVVLKNKDCNLHVCPKSMHRPWLKEMNSVPVHSKSSNRLETLNFGQDRVRFTQRQQGRIGDRRSSCVRRERRYKRVFKQGS